MLASTLGLSIRWSLSKKSRCKKEKFRVPRFLFHRFLVLAHARTRPWIMAQFSPHGSGRVEF
jgi:hypothetical protein